MSPKHAPPIGTVGERRRFGELEAAVLAALWASPEPMSPASVQEAIGGDLAYTTVMTILVRLQAKGVIERSKVGRAYRYRPVYSRQSAVTQAVGDMLERFF